MESLIFKKKLGEFYISPTKLSKEDKNVQYLIEINKTPFLFFISKHAFFFRVKLIDSDFNARDFILIKLDEWFDHTNIKSIKEYSNTIFDEMKEQIKDIDKLVEGDV